ncbi:MAG: 1-acyl-sn-glycerol-3-phosphate acyltransferase, partial [Proteobacteria bacterium]|nr:1-acyl-sn-glycerol-3-phosphate acyltransferase [Pseudomonadota bacterium]
MGFGPFGFLFRRAGAFFMRRSLDDPLYKEVFRSYVAYMVREGLTQEFFIEGTRSRTGKVMAPRLGMLSWDVEAFLASSRRDLFLVPISITYERLVEESTMVEELQGAQKTVESTLALVRARKYLQRRFGSVDMCFGEPISLAQALGDRRERFATDESEETVAEKRQFVESLGHRIVERINWGAVANATSVAACVLLGSPHRGLLREELVRRMQEVVDILRLEDARLTTALLADRGDFRESIAFLLRSDLLHSTTDSRGEILYFDESKRRALDIYRNSICQFLATPSFLARRVLCGGGATHKEFREDLAAWQELLYQEYFAPRGEILAAHREGFLDHFEARGWVESRGDALIPTAEGEPILRFLAEQTRGVIEAYHAAFLVAVELDSVNRKEFFKRAAAQFENAELLGEAQRRESANDSTFQNALDLLVRRGILEARKTEIGKGTKRGVREEVVYARGEHAAALGELTRRLAAALT